MLKFAFVGHSGTGKSTAASVAREFFENRKRKAVLLKLAQPLYELQKKIYLAAGKDIDLYEQDQELLEEIARQMRRISPTGLVDNFLKRLSVCDADVVLNDDLRDVGVDYPRLAAAGFVFIRMVCDPEVRRMRLGSRGDRSVVEQSATTVEIDEIEASLVIDNSKNRIEALRDRLCGALEELS